MTPVQAIVQLDRVDVDIDGSAVLHGIDLRLAPGQHWGIVGGNGSGKSTLLALLAGKRWPAPGRGSRTYDFGEGPERDAITARQRIALLGHELQDLYFARGWNFRVGDVVLSGFTQSDIPKRRPKPALRARAIALLERLQLDQLAERRILELSRGEQRGVLIARALAMNPALLLLDEPTSGLDAAACVRLAELLRRAAGSTQIVIAAHRREDLPDIVTNIARLEAGRLTGPTVSRAQCMQASGTLPEQDSGLPSRLAADRPLASAANEILIAIGQADLWLDGRRVLGGIDWTLREGEHWLITGPNGAGKSSFLRLLYGELRPARGGSIRWPGLGDPANVWALRRRMGLVSPELQARYLYPTTVFDAIASGMHASIGRVRRLAPAEHERVAALLADFELEPLGGRLIRTLSYGQRHRVLIARALATRPRVLLLDEPWAGLDPSSAAVVRRETERHMASGTQLVCVSHVGAGGLPFNRQLRIEDGQLFSDGDSAERRGSSASAPRREPGSRRR